MAAILSWLAPRGSGSAEARDEGASPVPPSGARETPPLPAWLLLNLRKDWDVLNSPREEERTQDEVLDAAWSRLRQEADASGETADARVRRAADGQAG